MNRLAYRGSLLLVAAIVAACAARHDDQVQAPAKQTQQDPASPEVRAAPGTRAREEAPVSDRKLSAVTTGNIELLRAPSSACCVAPIYQQPTNTERYQHLNDNPVHVALEEPVSTFSIDVDTGAYANVRRYINGGQLPPQDAVR